MSDIVEFISARLDKDQQAAREASGGTVVGHVGSWSPSPAGDEWEARANEHGDEELLVALRPGLPRPPAVTGGYWGAVVSTNSSELGRDEMSPMAAFRHAARHDPARALAEVAAKRRHLEMWADANAQRGKALDMANSAEPLMQKASIAVRARANGLCDAWALVLCLDAAIYADHEDYQEAWKPA